MNNSNAIAILQGRAGIPAFLLLAAAVYGAVIAVYSFYFNSTPLLEDLVDFVADSSVQVLSVLGFTTEAYEFGNNFTKNIRHESNAEIIVNREAVAAFYFAALITSVVAWPGKIVKKVPVLVFGVGLMFLVNCLRIAILMTVNIHMPLHIDAFYTYGSPLYMVAFVMLYFYFWTVVSGEHPADFTR